MLIINTKDLAKHQVANIQRRYGCALWYAFGFKDAQQGDIAIDADAFATSEALLMERHERRGGYLRSIQESFKLWLAEQS